ncbi:MAG: ABC transporter permease [Flexilinea sp.]
MPEIKKKNTNWLKFLSILMKGRAFIALIIVIILFTIIVPNFVNSTNLVVMTKHVAIYATLAIGMTFVILTGGIDLSVGSVAGLCAMMAGGFINEGITLGSNTYYPSIPMVMILTMAIGTFCGMINGLIIAKFNVAAFIATLGMWYVARGFAQIRSNGLTFPNLVGREELGNTGFPLLGAGSFLGISYSIWIMLAFMLAAMFITLKIPFGRHVYAIGGNEKAARMSGVAIDKTKIGVYAISGFCASVVGLIIASQLVASHPMTGDSYEMTAIAAVVLGGASLAGGIGSIGGTVIGAFVIGILSDGLVMAGVSSFWQQVAKGAVIVFAVIIDQVQRRLQERVSLSQQADGKESDSLSS